MQFKLPAYFEYIATFIWATSGALLAAKRGFAIVGIGTVAVISSMGGGLIRDGIFLQQPPVMVRSPVYLQLVLLAVILVIAFGAKISRLPRGHQVVSLVDAMGLGAYAAVGMCLALEAGMTSLGVVVVGMVNAVGGGILRDLLLRQEISMFKPGTLEELIALLGCFQFLILIRWVHLHQVGAAWLTIITVFTLRMLAIHFNIRSKPLPGYDRA